MKFTSGLETTFDRSQRRLLQGHRTILSWWKWVCQCSSDHNLGRVRDLHCRVRHDRWFLLLCLTCLEEVCRRSYRTPLFADVPIGLLRLPMLRSVLHHFEWCSFYWIMLNIVYSVSTRIVVYNVGFLIQLSTRLFNRSELFSRVCRIEASPKVPREYAEASPNSRGS
jgi:hypothetical protein